MKNHKFKSVVKKYDVVFFDAFGVLKNSSGLIDGINNTFSYLKENGIDFYILTNDASRSPRELAESYIKKGLSVINEHKIISSGMLAREYLRYKVKKGTVAYLGTENSAHYIEELGLKTISIANVDINDVSGISALVFLDDEGFDWNHDINKIVNLLRKRNIPVVVANTDMSYPVSGSEVAIAIGSIANMVEKILGRTFIRFGKPDPQMFNFAYEHITVDKHIPRNKILMVGDTLATDIIGGNKFGIDTVLVLTGNTISENVNARIKSSGIIPDYICDSAVIE
ncbi:TIGR01459 family HAD-type hydrolase [Reichenbachiella sp. MALMAid0571]|uniref:TIGR01459 family HAD-type hydrolase n=1 Tax=Reichenbachiella sp. MALMAid0571 TaxID=3143939 RepID=UPI0032DFAFD9